MMKLNYTKANKCCPHAKLLPAAHPLRGPVHEEQQLLTQNTETSTKQHLELKVSCRMGGQQASHTQPVPPWQTTPTSHAWTGTPKHQHQRISTHTSSMPLLSQPRQHFAHLFNLHRISNTTDVRHQNTSCAQRWGTESQEHTLHALSPFVISQPTEVIILKILAWESWHGQRKPELYKQNNSS